MIDELDEAIRKMLVRELPIRKGEVDIKFDQPKREWSSRLSKPTLNVFLYDVRENQKLRQAQPMWETIRNPDGTATQRRKPVRMDLHYLITAWATEPEDEHRLIARTLMALFRYANLPEDLLSEGLIDQNRPISIMAAQYNELNNPADMWNVLDNEVRPGIMLMLTVMLDPYLPITVPLVRERELVMGQSQRPPEQRLDSKEEADIFWTIGGNLRSSKPLDPEKIRVTLVERNEMVPFRNDGRFTIGRLKAGAYTLEVTAGEKAPRRYALRVPTADIDLEVEW